MEEKYEKMFEGARGFISFVWGFFAGLIQASFKLFLLAGAFVSFILLLKLFPDTAMKFYYSLSPFLNILGDIIRFSFNLLGGLIAIYFSARIVFAIIDYHEEQKVKNVTKRLLMIDDISEMLLDKIKRDKNGKKK